MMIESNKNLLEKLATVLFDTYAHIIRMDRHSSNYFFICYN